MTARRVRAAVRVLERAEKSMASEHPRPSSNTVQGVKSGSAVTRSTGR